MALDGRHALTLLDAIGNANSQKEYYLTGIVAVARSRGFKVAAVIAAEDEVWASTTEHSSPPPN